MPRLLIWGPEHWGGGHTRPCITCGRPALLINSQRQPQHKVCAEAVADAASEQAATRYHEKRDR
ncbi:hypothetical protein [Streptacidiphilus albus]|uniref:hypothetical protein n=1 Tax=Streptacidiphilus albus TaxID=105425 RepID=UPI00054BEE36|nr:hypothetical protein [Streptacidiphilus albus]